MVSNVHMYIICPPHLVPHGVPRCQAAVSDARLTTHHGFAGGPVSGGVTEPPPVPEKTLEIVTRRSVSGSVCYMKNALSLRVLEGALER